ncbi:MAG: hypothetical protein H8E28_14085 [Anaerolineae bacterium]|nr:hypothetical protein [Anaerolineae bacterium]
MKRSSSRKVHASAWIVLFSALILAACEMPGGEATPAAEVVIADAVQQTFIAQTVEAASRPSDTPQPAPPTETPLPEVVEAPSETPLPPESPTPGVPMVGVSVDTNCRYGPGKTYDQLGFLTVGEETEVIARDPSGYYWYVRNPDRPGGYCWLWGEYATVVGDTSTLPIYTPPPTPTPTFTATPSVGFEVVFRQVDACAPNWRVEFRLTNTGNLAFESVSVRVTDNDTAETVNYNDEEFEDWNACALSTSSNELGPGGVDYAPSGNLSADPTGHSVTATITVCTDPGLGGTCISKTITFTP